MPRTLKMSDDQMVNELRNTYGVEFTAADIRGYCASTGVSYQTVTKRLEQYKVGRGKWNLEVTTEVVKKIENSFNAPAVEPQVQQNLIPERDDTFVKFGPFNDIKSILKSGIFYPTFITGLSGNGKTFSVEQACAQLNRELIRVNITIETDEDDLLGGFRLIDGSTVWHNGPVVEALERGAVLLLDEIDLASNKILCLQSILEGNGVFLKKIGKFVKPTAGFNVVATANTKGKGSEDGRFIGTNVLNEAFLERFPVTFEQQYPSVATEKKILERVASSVNAFSYKKKKYVEKLTNDGEWRDIIVDSDNVSDLDFYARLADWADIIRKTFYDGGIEEIISTRRLVHIVRAYSIFNNKAKAIEVCVNRFDDDTKQAFLELYDKVDADVDLDKLEDAMYD